MRNILNYFEILLLLMLLSLSCFTTISTIIAILYPLQLLSSSYSLPFPTSHHHIIHMHNTMTIINISFTTAILTITTTFTRTSNSVK